MSGQIINALQIDISVPASTLGAPDALMMSGFIDRMLALSKEDSGCADGDQSSPTGVVQFDRSG